MRNRSKVLLAALAATAILGAAITSASARRIASSEPRFSQYFSLLVDSGPTGSVTCPVTLEGSFHSRTISKVSGQLVGYVTLAKVGEASQCRGGSARANTETLPWHIRYESFTGTLPLITSITLQLVGARYTIQPSGQPACSATTSNTHPARGISTVSGGVITTLRADETSGIPLDQSEILCALAGNGRFIGTSEVFVLGSTTARITVTLVQ